MSAPGRSQVRIPKHAVRSTQGSPVSVLTRRRLLGGAALLATAAARPTAAQAPREIEVIAQRYKYTPNQITVKAGEQVVLVFRALDFMHGFHMPDLQLRADLQPGLLTRVALPPLQAGTLDFLCDNFCGDDHEDMHGRITVTA